MKLFKFQFETFMVQDWEIYKFNEVGHIELLNLWAASLLRRKAPSELQVYNVPVYEEYFINWQHFSGLCMIKFLPHLDCLSSLDGWLFSHFFSCMHMHWLVQVIIKNVEGGLFFSCVYHYRKQTYTGLIPLVECGQHNHVLFRVISILLHY